MKKQETFIKLKVKITKKTPKAEISSKSSEPVILSNNFIIKIIKHSKLKLLIKHKKIQRGTKTSSHFQVIISSIFKTIKKIYICKNKLKQCFVNLML